MIALNYDNKDSFVARLQRKGIDVRWNGWDIVFFREDKRALRNPNGVRSGSRWGFNTVISPNDDGQWLIDYRLTKVKSVATV